MRYTVEVDTDGSVFWYKEGTEIIHREGGPAVYFSDGSKHWYINGKWHREDGPAEEYPDGRIYWYLEGIEYSEEEFKKKLLEKKNSCDNKVVKIDGQKYKLVKA